mmetsp:Transcript_38916/g.86567  ORF Transcript_38916/g.86567 Transcript_38916/m.86567 type:complete len:345 (+) Transcript_38916:147-1181(+)|eukprot:CAMPEP_0202910310 /NCGR_PEP_ID=MMETSP1392-20130828/51681_1 /ASSEMBLY_ACC=CAM_ASM_000868 /TAXON_ID=225041 /ORGANISM="Chlamydomonas chlamydogama, Strain SAG 11-48b" /LENGTH=344 /DNA_ID=CAMNT_0049600379 /DNA_START=89 /DNA_END=1123 /DNA_ORIENTATION=-
MAAVRAGWTAVPTDEPSTSASVTPVVVKRPWIEGLKLALACGAWLAASSGIIIANRWIMVELKWPYPMAVAAMGMAVSGLFGYVVCDILKAVPAVDIDHKFYITRVFPIGALQALAMWLSNSLYLYLTVAFIEMCRALLPVFIMLALHFAGLESPTVDIVKAVALTAVGCALSAYGEVRLSTIGLACLFGNFTLEAGRLVLMQLILVGYEFSAMQGLKYIAPAAVLCLAVMSFFTEYPTMVKNNSFEVVTANWPLFLAAASMGLCVNLISNVIIKLSGSTTLKVLSAMRGPLVVLSGVFIFQEHVSWIEFVGYIVALTGFVWYNFAKTHQVAQKAVKATASPKE